MKFGHENYEKVKVKSRWQKQISRFTYSIRLMRSVYGSDYGDCFNFYLNIIVFDNCNIIYKWYFI